MKRLGDIHIFKTDIRRAIKKRKKVSVIVIESTNRLINYVEHRRQVIEANSYHFPIFDVRHSKKEVILTKRYDEKNNRKTYDKSKMSIDKIIDDIAFDIEKLFLTEEDILQAIVDNPAILMRAFIDSKIKEMKKC